jgi:UDP-2,3-diacylglucosamine hydrolase
LEPAAARPQSLGMASPGAGAALGILAGGSGVPCEIAEAVQRRGRAVHIVALEGEAEPEVARFPHTWVNLGGIGAMLRAFKQNGCGEIVIVGRVKRPNLVSIRPDLGFWTNLPILLSLLRGGDDAILRVVVGFFERHGLTVVGAHDAAPELIAPAGVMGRHQPGPGDLASIASCAGAIAALGPFDAAQAAIGIDGKLIAIEGADGTDAMLRRLAASRGPRGGVLVKVPKPGQDARVDLPAIGPETMRRALEARLSGIAVLSGQTLFAERRRALELADESGLFVTGIAPGDAVLRPRAPSEDPGRDTLVGLRAIAHQRPAAAQLVDARLGAHVLAAIEPYWPVASTIVSRGYVIATEGPGHASDAARRAGRLKPWGTRLLRRQSGVLVMTDIAGELGFDPGEIVRHAKASSLAGIVILRSARDEAALAALRTEADTHKLFLLAPGDAR